MSGEGKQISETKCNFYGELGQTKQNKLVLDGCLLLKTSFFLNLMIMTIVWVTCVLNGLTLIKAFYFMAAILVEWLKLGVVNP